MKRRRFPIGGTLLTIVILLPLVWFGAQHIGPRAAVPTQDPILALNAAGEATQPNAAERYRTALASFAEPAVKDWEDYANANSDPVPPELAAWVTNQNATIELIRDAAELPYCFFKYQRKPGDILENEVRTTLRPLTRLLAIRARFAAERQDLETLGDSLALMNAIGRHALQHPTTIDQLVGTAIVSMAVEHVATPFAWPETSAAEIAAYVEQVNGLFEPPPSLTPALALARDEWCWIWNSSIGGAKQLLLPKARVCGEVHDRAAPLLQLAGQTVEMQADPANPLHAQLDRQSSQMPPKWKLLFNLPSGVAWLVPTGFTHVIDLRIRTIATQRGCQTVTAVFLHRNDSGDFPASLDEVAGDFTIDPYTGKQFFYRPTDDGFTLYSAGLDRDDDGGRHDAKWGRQKSVPGLPEPPPDGDYVFWPIQD